jgi:serine protease Do
MGLSDLRRPLAKESSMSAAKTVYWKRAVLTAVLVPLLLGALLAASLPSAAKLPGESPLAVDTGPAKALSHAFRDAAKAVQPTVVLIKSEPAMPVKLEGTAPDDDEPSLDQGFGRALPGGPDLRRFFQELPRTPKHHQSGMGSGLIIDPAGLILTNNHVVSGGGQITVRLHDGREFKAGKIMSDPKTDLALLRIEGAGPLPAARLGNSDNVEVGDWVLALGHPFGLEGTVTAGIVSAKGRGIGITERENFLQTDAAINPGNSGGPLVNLDGEVIGINTAISSSSGGSEGIGFAVPINLAKWVAGQLTHGGSVHRARLGVIVQPLNYDLAQHFGLKVHEGVLVAQVMPDSAAAKTGMKPGDVIVEFANKSVSTPQELQAAVEQAEIGHAQTLVAVRDGKRLTLNVSPTEPAEKLSAAGGPAEAEPERTSRLEKLGIEGETLTAEIARHLGVNAEHGVAVTDVQSGSPAERAGLTTGMVIVEAGRKPVATIGDLVKVLDDKSMANGVLLLVRSGQGSRFIVIRN